jgi:hypothetical protein
MKTWRHEVTETWRHEDMETWRHGDMRQGDMETWRHGPGDMDMETWQGDRDMETSGAVSSTRHIYKYPRRPVTYR